MYWLCFNKYLPPAGAEGKLRSFAGPGHSSAEDGGVLHQVSRDTAVLVEHTNVVAMCAQP